MAAHVSPSTSPTKKSSRSESSSPTSIRPRARASSADDSSKKEVKQNRDKKETIEVRSYFAVLRIHDILGVDPDPRIRGSMPLTRVSFE